MKDVRVGVIGAGSMGFNHIRALSMMGASCSFIGIYDHDRSRAKTVSEQLSVPWYDSLSDLLSEINAVVVAVPTVYHYEICQMCLEHGVDVLVEKPITFNPDEADQLIKIATNKELLLQVGHVERFNPVFDVAKRVLENKEVIALDMNRLSPYDGRVQDIDVIQDLMIHDIDWITSLMGQSPIVRDAFGRKYKSSNLVDYAVAVLEFASGPLVTVTASRITEQKIRMAKITCNDSLVELDFLERKLLVSRATSLSYDELGAYRQQNVTQRVFVPNAEPLMMELNSFISAAKARDYQISVTGLEGKKAVEVVDEIRAKIYNQNWS